MTLDVIIPIYNESEIIEKSIKVFYKKINKFVSLKEWNFILVENGSTDDSFKKILKLKKSIKNIKVSKIKKSNYGASLKAGCLLSKSDYILIMNADHVWDNNFFKWCWKYKHKFDIIIGSKRSDPILNKQSMYRKILSGVLNLFLNFFLNSVLADTHGMKLLNRKNVLKEIKKCQLTRGQFDTELALRLTRGGYRVVELPVPYIEKRNSRNLMIRKILQNIFDIFKLIKIFKTIKVKSTVKYRRYSRNDVLNLYV
jgi:glycosyltransferase involved in cell wall biosynthesis